MADSLTPAQERVLVALKRLGSTTADDLARHLDLTGAAVRQHLASLERIGLAEPRLADEPEVERSRGRPPSLWSLTALAAGHFPDRHADLTVDLIRTIRSTLGDHALDQLIDERSRRQRKLYQAVIPPPGSPLRDRVEALASLRTVEGYMAEVVEEQSGVLRLIEHHCPICTAAETCQGLCRAELEVFRQTLGPDVTVERTTHLLTNGDRCVYRISKSD